MESTDEWMGQRNVATAAGIQALLRGVHEAHPIEGKWEHWAFNSPPDGREIDRLGVQDQTVHAPPNGGSQPVSWTRTCRGGSQADTVSQHTARIFLRHVVVAWEPASEGHSQARHHRRAPGASSIGIFSCWGVKCSRTPSNRPTQWSASRSLGWVTSRRLRSLCIVATGES